MRLAKLVEEFVADNCAGKTNETPVAYRRKLQHLLNYFGDCSVRSIAAADLAGWRRHFLGRPTKLRGYQQVDGHLSPATIHSTITAIKTFFRWCSDNGYITRNPAAELKNNRVPKAEPKAISTSTVEKLINAAAHIGEHEAERARNVAIICALRDTGGRVGGLCTADVSALDMKTGRLQVVEKGDQARTLYLNPPTMQAIKNWLAMRPQYKPQCDRLFLNRWGQPIGRGGVYSMLRRLAERAGVKDVFNPLAFRHALARDTLRAGADLSRVAQLMGHSAVRVTADYYARWADDELKRDHARFSPGRSLEIPEIPPD